MNTSHSQAPNSGGAQAGATTVRESTEACQRCIEESITARDFVWYPLLSDQRSLDYSDGASVGSGVLFNLRYED